MSHTHPISEKEAREAWRTAPLDDLVLHIVERYHMATRLELARLESLAEEAALLHGEGHPQLLVLRDEAAKMGHRMRAHLKFEERETFPTILAMAAGKIESPPPGQLDSMKKLLMDEHDIEAALLRTIRTLADALPPFEDPHGLRAKLASALRTLGEDLQQHLFLENQILFQRAF